MQIAYSGGQSTFRADSLAHKREVRYLSIPIVNDNLISCQWIHARLFPKLFYISEFRNAVSERSQHIHNAKGGGGAISGTTPAGSCRRHRIRFH